MPTLAELAALLNGSVDGASDLMIDGVAVVQDAIPGQLTFITNDKFISRLEASRASAVLTAPGKPTYGKAALIVADPLAALPVLLAQFAPIAPGPDELIDRTAWLGRLGHRNPRPPLGMDRRLGGPAHAGHQQPNDGADE